MSEPYLGQLMCVGFTFNNRGWSNCDGQILPINQNTSLFSLFGTMYGGDGRTTFGLPGLQGRVPIHVGQGPGLPDYRQGSSGGSPTVTLNVTEIPAHGHNLFNGTGNNQANITLHGIETPANSQDPEDNVLGQALNFHSGTANVPLGSSAGTIGGQTALTGGGQSHNNMQPYQTLRWLVAMVGVYPSRN